MPRPAAAATLPDTAGQPPADTAPEFFTRFPARWLGTVTGDTLRAVTLVGDYARGRDGYCWAADRTLAATLQLHPRTVAAALRTAEGLGLVVAERRRGGTSARTLAPAAEDELMVCVTAAARTALSGARWLVYCALAVRQHLDARTSLRRLTVMCGISVGTVRAAVAELVASGWITRADTAGAAARYTAHPAPVPGVATQLGLFAEPRRRAAVRGEQLLADLPGECDGQLSLDFTPVGSAPATPVDSAPATPADLVPQTGTLDQDLVNKPAALGSCGSGAADTPVPRVTGGRPGTRATSARAGRPSASPAPTSTLPPLLVTAPIRRVLAELPAALVDGMSRWEQREAARAIGTAIRAAGGDANRVADRVVRRWALADPAAIRTPYGWITRIGLTRRGCSLSSCESGYDLATGAACSSCAYLVEGARARAAARRAAPRPVPVPRVEQLPAARAATVPQYCAGHPSTVLPCALCAAPATPEPAPDPAARARALATARAARAGYRGTTHPVAA